ncbi:hypothetical protein AMATHDRAFT_154495 [Amanita thiersii Skay4041]|uniref:Uncharacterized protein n=1 Tax=Amanita thiersii Skay4041 TaxID=703135 RepID=A0A2A9NFU9_9AGAR|nr:hypothetical protein AMATHDRAFT_154495 [Amanita thiersii Skay4041]
MQTVVPRTANFFTRFLNLRGSWSGVPSKYVDGAQTPLFLRIPPWWARWTWALVACDLFMTGSAIELTWNHWSQLVSDLEKIGTKNKEASGGVSTPTPTTGTNSEGASYIMRPAWQRLGLCAAHLTLGVGVAAALLVTQARFVRTIAILPPATTTTPASQSGRRVFVQCAHNWRNHGMTFSLSRCSLEEGRNETEMVFRVLGERGHWYVGLQDAIVHGHQVGVLQARNAILEEWRQQGEGKLKRVGKWSAKAKVETNGKWKSGPVIRNVQ